MSVSGYGLATEAVIATAAVTLLQLLVKESGLEVCNGFYWAAVVFRRVQNPTVVSNGLQESVVVYSSLVGLY